MRLPLLDGRPKSGLCDAVTKCAHVDVLLRNTESSAYSKNGKNGTLNTVLGLSGSKLLQAVDESGIERLRMPMSDGTNVCVAEAVPALHILNGRWQRPSRHERIIEAHHQVGERHHLL